MRIVFSGRPAFGHLFPMMPLAAAAQAAGHDVIFATGEQFLARLDRWGFRSRKVGGSIEEAFQPAYSRWPELMDSDPAAFEARMFVDTLAPGSLQDMRKTLEDTRADLVVYEQTDLGAGVAAAAAGVPAVCHALSVWIDSFTEAMRDRLDDLWRSAGAVPSIDVTTGDLFLDIWPPSMQEDGATRVASRRLLRPAPWGAPDAEVPAWVGDTAGPLVFVSLGTMFYGKTILEKIVEALRDVECDAIVVATPDARPDGFEPHSDRVRIVGFVNQAAVLRHADVVVHHGGAGTVLQALERGLPALAIGYGVDRPFTSASLKRSGAGLVLNPETATPRQIAEALRALLDDGRYRASARAVAEEIARMPSPETVVRDLESLAKR